MLNTVKKLLPFFFLFLLISPVLAESTFGNTSEGTGSYGASDQYVHATYVTLSEEANVYRICLFTKCAGGSDPCTCAIYSDDGGEPNELLVVSDEVDVTDTSFVWYNFTIANTTLQAGNYWLAFVYGTPTSGYYTTLGTTPVLSYQSITYPNFTDPFVQAGTLGRVISIYAVYDDNLGGGDPETLDDYTRSRTNVYLALFAGLLLIGLIFLFFVARRKIAL